MKRQGGPTTFTLIPAEQEEETEALRKFLVAKLPNGPRFMRRMWQADPSAYTLGPKPNKDKNEEHQHNLDGKPADGSSMEHAKKDNNKPKPVRSTGPAQLQPLLLKAPAQATLSDQPSATLHTFEGTPNLDAAKNYFIIARHPDRKGAFSVTPIEAAYTFKPTRRNSSKDIDEVEAQQQQQQQQQQRRPGRPGAAAAGSTSEFALAPKSVRRQQAEQAATQQADEKLKADVQPLLKAERLEELSVAASNAHHTIDADLIPPDDDIEQDDDGFGGVATAGGDAEDEEMFGWPPGRKGPKGSRGRAALDAAAAAPGRPKKSEKRGGGGSYKSGGKTGRASVGGPELAEDELAEDIYEGEEDELRPAKPAEDVDWEFTDFAQDDDQDMGVSDEEGMDDDPAYRRLLGLEGEEAEEEQREAIDLEYNTEEALKKKVEQIEKERAGNDMSKDITQPDEKDRNNDPSKTGRVSKAAAAAAAALNKASTGRPSSTGSRGSSEDYATDDMESDDMMLPNVKDGEELDLDALVEAAEASIINAPPPLKRNKATTHPSHAPAATGTQRQQQQHSNIRSSSLNSHPPTSQRSRSRTPPPPGLQRTPSPSPQLQQQRSKSPLGQKSASATAAVGAASGSRRSVTPPPMHAAVAHAVHAPGARSGTPPLGPSGMAARSGGGLGSGNQAGLAAAAVRKRKLSPSAGGTSSSGDAAAAALGWHWQPSQLDDQGVPTVEGLRVALSQLGAVRTDQMRQKLGIMHLSQAATAILRSRLAQLVKPTTLPDGAKGMMLK